jgi:uncharacterized protein
MNITSFGLPFAYADPSVAGGATGADFAAWLTTALFFEGTQRGLFSLLFGAGIVLMTRSLEKSGRPHALDIFFRRNIWLIVFGVIHGFLLLWTGEILFYYGATALFVWGFRHAPPKTLLALAAGGLLFGAAWNGLDTYNALDKHRAFVTADSARVRGDSLSAEQKTAVEQWEGFVKELKPDSAKIATEIAVMRGSYWGIVKHQAPRLTHFQSWWLYRFFFDIWSMMLIGMALYKMRIITGEQSTRLYAGLALGGYTVGLVTNSLEAAMIVREGFSVLAFSRSNITYDLGRLAMTTGHVGVVMLFCRSGIFPWLQRGLSAVGRMAFTNYVMTSIICAFVFYGFGFALFGQLQRHELYYVVAGIWLFQVVLSPIWLRRYRFGPLEFVWRWLTYGERPVMRV